MTSERLDMQRELRMVIVDDHGILRAGLQALLDTEPGFVVVGEASCGEEALPLVERLRPDLVLMDISLPQETGIETTLRIKERHPGVAVLILTVNEDKSVLQEAIHAGASGFLIKRALGKELFKAIRTVMRGEIYIHPRMLHALLDEVQEIEKDPSQEVEELTPRETEVLQLIARGYTNSQIADLLSISERTVEFHRSNITGKLHLKSRVALVRFAVEHGLVKFQSSDQETVE